MAETADKVYAVTSGNIAAGSPNQVAVINDGTGDRQVVVLGAGDGTTNLNDGSNANPLNIAKAAPALSTATWGTGTTINTALSNTSALNYSTVTVTTIETGTTTTAGALTFEVYDGTNWWAVTGQQIGGYTAQSTYTLVNGVNVAWQFDIAGFQGFRVRLSTAITGTGTPQVVVILQLQASENDINMGSQVRTSEQTAITSGFATLPIVDKTGKTIALPYANPENFVKGTGNATGTSTTSLISLVSSQKIYVTSISVVNTGSTSTYVNLQDGSGGTTLYTIAAPASGGATHTLPVPFSTTAGNGLYFAAGNSNTTLYMAAAGYSGV